MYDNKDDKDNKVTKPFDDSTIKLTDRKEDQFRLVYTYIVFTYISIEHE